MKIWNLYHWSISLTVEYLPSRPSVDSSFSSRMVRNTSPFNMLSSQGGGTTGGTRIIVAAGAGIVFTARGVATGALVQSGRDLARTFAPLDYRSWSSSGSESSTWESTDYLSLLELCSRVSDTGLLPLSLPPFGGAVFPIIGGLVVPSFISMPRAILRGGMSKSVLAISAKHCRKLKTFQEKSHKIYCR